MEVVAGVSSCHPCIAKRLVLFPLPTTVNIFTVVGRGNNTSLFAMQGWQEETPATTSIWEHLSFFNIGRINVANPIWKGKT